MTERDENRNPETKPFAPFGSRGPADSGIKDKEANRLVRELAAQTLLHRHTLG
jgi:hypothetical protein